jgi:acetoin utilization deacetylase AcuC-like enzyme
MEFIYNQIFLQHETGMHPENPKRLAGFSDLPDTPVPSGEPYLGLIHTPRYIQEVKAACAQGRLISQETPTSPGSWEAAIRAVGATLLAAERNDFALVRPPGHHAYPDHSSGFCLFNNISIAAQKLANEGKKVLILDIDGHLGDGISHIFYGNHQVMYWSVHQYPAFPGWGWIDEFGTDMGEGYTLNVPLPPGAGDDIFQDAIRTFLPVAQQFEPDVVAVAAGFDGHKYDLLLDLRLTFNSFHWVGKTLAAHFPNIFATLEGGYSIGELRRCAESFMAGINGEELIHLEKATESSRSVWDTYDINCHSAISNLQPYWKF